MTAATLKAGLVAVLPEGADLRITSIAARITSNIELAGTRESYGSPAAPTGRLTAFKDGLEVSLGVNSSDVRITAITENRRRRLLAGNVKISFEIELPPEKAKAAAGHLKKSSFGAELSKAVERMAESLGLNITFPVVVPAVPKTSTKVQYEVVVESSKPMTALRCLRHSILFFAL